jgi:hypothetical protein
MVRFSQNNGIMHPQRHKDKAVPALNWLSTTPWRRMGEWKHRSTFSWPRYWLGVVSFTSRPLYPQGNSPRYPLDRGWVGPRTGLDDVEKRKFLNLLGLELRPIAHSSITIPDVRTSNPTSRTVSLHMTGKSNVTDYAMLASLSTSSLWTQVYFWFV